MTIKYHYDVIQYSEAWNALKCGVLSASMICDILTPEKLEISNSETAKRLVNRIAYQRISKIIEPTFQSYDMRRGLVEEKIALWKYNDAYAPVTECGFVTNDKWGFKIGCSPDALIGDDGGWECKSSLNDLQFAIVLAGVMPKKHKLQVQCSMMVCERQWWDFTNYSSAMCMMTVRIEPDPVVFKAIENAAFDFEDKVKVAVEEYGNRLADGKLRILPTERTPDDDDIISSSEEEAA